MDIFQFNNLMDLEKVLGDERSCRDQYEKLRWGGKPVCPHCESERVYTLTPGKFNNRYKCANNKCYRKFNLFTGTIFESTKKPMTLWFRAMYLLVTDKKGISSYGLAEKLGITQTTAWFMMHRLRETVRKKRDVVLSGSIQADETFVGGKNKNRHADKKVHGGQGRAFIDKTPVMGLMQDQQSIIVLRPHKVIPGLMVRQKVVVTPAVLYAKALTDTNTNSIQPVIRKVVKPGSTIISDEWYAYTTLADSYDHRVVDHTRKEYVNANGDTTNRIEGAWKGFKGRINVTHHQVSRKHLQRYADEYTFRYNTRHITAQQRFILALSQSNTRLKYKDLIQRT